MLIFSYNKRFLRNSWRLLSELVPYLHLRSANGSQFSHLAVSLCSSSITQHNNNNYLKYLRCCIFIVRSINTYRPSLRRISVVFQYGVSCIKKQHQPSTLLHKLAFSAHHIPIPLLLTIYIALYKTAELFKHSLRQNVKHQNYVSSTIMLKW